MSSYPPPTENVAIFDTALFKTGDSVLTYDEADNRYLRFPNAQGTETLQAINVGGLATFNDAVIMNEGASILTTVADTLTIADATNSANNSDIYHVSSTLTIANRTTSGEINFYASDSLGASKKSFTIGADNTIVNSVLNVYDPNLTSPNDYSTFYQTSATLTNQYESTNGRFIIKIDNGTGGYASVFDVARNAGSLSCNAISLTSTSGTTVQANDIGATGTLIVRDTSGNNQTLFIPNTPGGAYNSIVPPNVQGIISYNPTSSVDTQTLVLSTHASKTAGVIVSPISSIIGFGGTSSIPTNYFYSDTSGNIIGGTTNFLSTSPPTSNQVIPAANDSSTKIPTTAWVQSAISSIVPTTQFVPKFVNYSDVQYGSSGYSNGTQINFGGSWAINDIVYFRITSQISYNPDGTGAYQNTGNTMGVIYFRPYYFSNGWAPASSSGGTLQKYCSNTGGAADRQTYYYLPSFNIGNTGVFYLNGGGVTTVRLSVLNPGSPYQFFCSIEYLGGRTASGTISFSNGGDANGVNNVLP